MHDLRKNIELLAPAGNFEKLEIALHYGADAVYLAGKDFSLRNFSGNFSRKELVRAVALAHGRKARVYVACNVYSRDSEHPALRDFLFFLKDLRPDGLIVSDPGVILCAQEIVPQLPLHLSTQANTTNSLAAAYWKKQGVRRINVARELSLGEIKTLADHVPVEIEAFVHGAMCISYSGRCLLSSFMENRDGNRGMCCQPCRFSYAVVEAKRPGQFYPLAEDQRGAYIFNSRDLCMIEHLPEMIAAGITAFKIEGRMKGINYLASVVKTYRAAIDAYLDDPAAYTCDPAWKEALATVSNRGYGTGFYLGAIDNTRPDYAGNLAGGHRFIAKVLEPLPGGRDGYRARVEVRNKIFTGDDIDIVTPGAPNGMDTIKAVHDADGGAVEFAQPGSLVVLTVDTPLKPFDLIRRRRSAGDDCKRTRPREQPKI
ncbi:MAG: U32 family peptidase [Deltaproteobacteria bacterium]|nr:U32 family peptidase [Deltaproteobacteria bacterium]